MINYSVSPILNDTVIDLGMIAKSYYFLSVYNKISRRFADIS